MLTYPAINPIALQIGFLKIHWYGLMYVVGFLAAWWLATVRARKNPQKFSSQEIADLLFLGAMGAIIGGRIGYMLFYDFSTFVAHPLSLFKIWQGGMSFHGGFIGVLGALLWFCYRFNKNFFDMTDFVAPLVPIGLGAGRIGNFINGELWGRVTSMPWGMVFPTGGSSPRHPSQLYEFLLEGVTLFLILWFYSAKPKPRLAVSGMFLVCYGSFRFCIEFFRSPDIQLGFIAFGWLTMGQLLSFPMIILGCYFLYYAHHHPIRDNYAPIP